MTRQLNKYVTIKRQLVTFRPVGKFERCPCGDWAGYSNLPLCGSCWRESGAWQPWAAKFHRLSWLDHLVRWYNSRRWRS